MDISLCGELFVTLSTKMTKANRDVTKQQRQYEFVLELIKVGYKQLTVFSLSEMKSWTLA